LPSKLRVTAEHDRATAATLGEKTRLMAMAEQMARIAYWRIDLPGNELTWSDELYHMLGLPKSYRPELESAIELYHPDHRFCVKGCIEPRSTAWVCSPPKWSSVSRYYPGLSRRNELITALRDVHRRNSVRGRDFKRADADVRLAASPC
jgi:hypothetical protein